MESPLLLQKKNIEIWIWKRVNKDKMDSTEIKFEFFDLRHVKFNELLTLLKVKYFIREDEKVCIWRMVTNTIWMQRKSNFDIMRYVMTIFVIWMNSSFRLKGVVCRSIIKVFKAT